MWCEPPWPAECRWGRRFASTVCFEHPKVWDAQRRLAFQKQHGHGRKFSLTTCAKLREKISVESSAVRHRAVRGRSTRHALADRPTTARAGRRYLADEPRARHRGGSVRRPYLLLVHHPPREIRFQRKAHRHARRLGRPPRRPGLQSARWPRVRLARIQKGQGIL